MKTRISIVIVVKNERGIADTLAKLQAQINAETEIIVIDASDAVPLTDIAAQYPKVRWLPYLSPKPKAFTIPEQRNAGVLAARGDVIVFIDAGGEPAARWLHRLTAPILAGTEMMCAGRVLATDPRIFQSFKHRPSEDDYLESAPTGNLAVHKSVYKTVGLFDERLTYGEDVDFTWRAVDHGYTIRYVPDAVIAYDFGTWMRRVRRTVRYGAARVPLYKKHRARLSRMLHYEPATVAYPVFLIGLPLTVVWPYYPLLLVPLFVKNLRQDPLRTLANNLLFGAGVLRGMAALMTARRKARSLDS